MFKPIYKKTIQSILALVFFTVGAYAKDTPFLSGDVGGSTGTNNGNTYQEIHLGIDMNFTDWLTLRNTGFKRTGSNIKEVTGLDSTLRLILRGKLDKGSAYLFAGSGYRWADESANNAVVSEAGLGISIAGFGLTGGAKYLKYTKERYDKDNQLMKDHDLNYFLGLSGSTSFGK